MVDGTRRSPVNSSKGRQQRKCRLLQSFVYMLDQRPYSICVIFLDGHLFLISLHGHIKMRMNVLLMENGQISYNKTIKQLLLIVLLCKQVIKMHK